MACPRCNGCLELEAVSLDGADGWMFLSRCLNCGHRGDALMDHHHALPIPPDPHHVDLPVFDPTHARLTRLLAKKMS